MCSIKQSPKTTFEDDGTNLTVLIKIEAQVFIEEKNLSQCVIRVNINDPVTSITNSIEKLHSCKIIAVFKGKEVKLDKSFAE